VSEERWRLACGLTLVALLWHPIGSGWLRPAFLLLAGCGLLLPGALRRPALWLGLAGVAALRLLLDSPLPDNHAYLMVWWCLAIGLTLREPEPAAALAWSGRLLIGLVFGFAFLWKALLSPDFVNGDFQRFTWLTDSRFELAARWLGGLSPGDLEENRAFLMGARDAPGALILTPALRAWTWAATLWTLLIEGALAASFLAPARLTAGFRDGLLLTFCVVTYAFAPVAGFAWLLLAMGLAQARPGRCWSAAYLTVDALMLIYDQEPWAWLV
jgi:hypothetical protein